MYHMTWMTYIYRDSLALLSIESFFKNGNLEPQSKMLFVMNATRSRLSY